MQKGSLLLDCESAIQKLRKNRENIPLEILKTRYASAYQKLLEDIQDMVMELIKRILVQSLPFCADDLEAKEQFLNKFQRVLEEEASNGVFLKISHAIFHEYDLWRALEIVEQIWVRIRREAYGPYWVSHCYEHKGLIHNTIINMVWDREHEIWVDTDDCRVTLMLPPSMELFDQEFQATGLTGKR